MADETTQDKLSAALKAGLASERKDGDKPADETPPAAEPEQQEDDAAEDEQTAPADTDPYAKDDGSAFTRADHAALMEALNKARKEAREGKAEVTRLTAAAGGKDVAQVVAEADTRAAEKWKPQLVRAHARGMFAEAGLALPADRADEVFGRAVRLLDLDSLTVADDGQVEGLREQIEEIRTDFPELFRTATVGAPRAPKVSASDKPTGPPPKKSLDEILAERMMGGTAA